MAQKTPTQIYSTTRTLLGADESGGAAVFNDTFLGSLMSPIWADFYRICSKYGVPHTEHESFVRLEPHQDYVNLVRSGLPNPSALLEVWVGKVDTITNIPLSPAPSTDPTTGFVRLQPYDLTGFADGDEVQVIMDQRFFGVICDSWRIKVEAPYVILLGAYADVRPPADYAGVPDGWLVKCDPHSWRMLTGPVSSDPEMRAVAGPSNEPMLWSTRGQAIRIAPPSDQVRILSVVYRVSGDSTFISTDSPVIADDVESMVANWLAGYAARAKGQPGWETYLQMALGPNFLDLNGEPGGQLGSWISNQIKTLQQMPTQANRFRAKNMNKRMTYFTPTIP
jgi:hypothetical protein